MSRPARFALLATLALLMCSAACAQRIELGDWTLKGDILSSVSIVSRSIKTNVILVEDNNVEAPTISVTAVGPFPVAEVSRGIVEVSGSNMVIRNWDGQYPPIEGSEPDVSPLQSSVSSGAVAHSSGMPSALQLLCLPAIVLIALVQSHPQARIGLLAVVAIASIALTQADSRPFTARSVSESAYLEIRVRIPTNMTDDSSVSIGSLTLDLVDGFVVSELDSSFTINQININMCQDTIYGGSVSLDAVVVMESLSVCAPGSVSISNLVQGSPKVEVSVQSLNESVAVSVHQFDGTYDVRGGISTSTSGESCSSSPPVRDTSNDGSHSYGSCGASSASTASRNPATTSTITVVAATTASLTVASGCPVGFTGDGPKPYVAPTSPVPVPTTTYAKTYNTPDLWRAWIPWGNSDSSTSIALMNATNAVTLSVAGYVPGTAWMTTRVPVIARTLPSTYKVRLSPQSGAPPFIRASMLLIKGAVSASGWNILNDAFPDTSPQVVSVFHWNGPFTGAEQSFTLTVPADSFSYTLVLRVTWNKVNNPFKLDVQTTYTSSISEPTTFQTGASELVTQQKMPSALDPNPRTVADCPHLASGLLHWHDPATWGGTMPDPNGNIRIPAGKSVLISSCSLLPSFIYRRISIPSTSRLIFADADIDLRVRNIYVNGKMSIGSPTCRLNGNVNITFVGSKTLADDIAATMGSKGIGVSSAGTLDIHGTQFHPTWTRISATIFPGTNMLYLQDSNNWEVGQSIVVATSAYNDLDNDQNEVRKIVAIDQGGKRIQVDSPFNFYHYGGYEHQAEVGLLSRRIILQGDDASEAEQFGGHTRVMGVGRFSGVMTYRMGQTNVLGKYPFHFHMVGNAPNNYVKDCSIWRSYFRCIAIHATNSTTNLRNVAYNAIGHCYYLEDGVEEHNVLNYNLAVKVTPIGRPMEGQAQTGEELYSSPDLILPADGAAGGFYITNAQNTFIGNAASGGWAGFSFPGLVKPIGPSRNKSMSPETRPIKLFHSNTAHSSGYKFPGGGCFYIGGKLEYRPAGSDTLYYNNGRFSRLPVDDAGQPIFAGFNDTKAWMCKRGISHWGDRFEVYGLEVHDSGRSAQMFGDAWLTRVLVNAESKSLYKFQGEQIGFQFYDISVRSIVTRVTFRNFLPNNPPYNPAVDLRPNTWEDRRAITALIHSDLYKPQGISATAHLRFDNSAVSQYVGHKMIETGASRYFNFVDWSGDMAGTPGVPQIIASGLSWWNYDPACVFVTAWQSWRCPQNSRVIANFRYLVPDLILDNSADLPPVPANYLGNTYLFGPGIPEGRNATFTKTPGITGISEMGWYIQHYSGTPSFFQIAVSVIPNGHYVMAAWKYPAGTTFTVSIKHKNGRPTIPVTAATSFNQLLTGNGRMYYFDDKHLHLKVHQPYADLGARNHTRDGVTIYSVIYSVYFEVTANCPGKTGTTCPSSYLYPTLWN